MSEPMTDERLVELDKASAVGWGFSGETLAELLAEVRRLREVVSVVCNSNVDLTTEVDMANAFIAELRAALESVCEAIEQARRVIPDVLHDRAGIRADMGLDWSDLAAPMLRRIDAEQDVLTNALQQVAHLRKEK